LACKRAVSGNNQAHLKVKSRLRQSLAGLHSLFTRALQRGAVTIFETRPRETKGNPAMNRYLIERDIPNVGRLTRAQLKDLAATSNSVLYRLGGKVQWVHSYIAADKTFCIYLAESELLVREHSRLAGFPVTKITKVPTVIDPMTGFSSALDAGKAA
jgi:hypothetical protein